MLDTKYAPKQESDPIHFTVQDLIVYTIGKELDTEDMEEMDKAYTYSKKSNALSNNGTKDKTFTQSKWMLLDCFNSIWLGILIPPIFIWGGGGGIGLHPCV